MFFRRDEHGFRYAPSGSAGDAAEEVVDATETEVENEAPVESAVEGAVEAEADVPPDLGEVFKKLNITGLPSDRDALLSAWQETQAKAKRADELQNHLLWRAHQEQQQEAARQAQKPAEPKKKVFELPEYDPRWLQLVEKDENGRLIAISGADPTLPQKIQAYAAAREDAVSRFLDDPVGLIQSNIGEYVTQQAQQIAGQLIQQHAEQQYLNQETEKYRGVLVDDNNQPTRAGQVWNSYYTQFKSVGMPYWQAGQMAHKSLDGDIANLQWQQEAAKAPTDEQKKIDFLKGAARQPNRSGSMPKTTRKTPPQNEKDLWKGLEQRVKQLPPEDFD